jgi:Outer membrane protein beta-barrel family
MKNYLFIIFGFFSIAAFGQFKIKGVVNDTTNNAKIIYATVTVVREVDSAIIAFTRTNLQGEFALNLQDTGQYYLLYAHPQFANFKEPIYINGDTKLFTKNNIVLANRGKLLQEIVIRQKGSMRIKGDTTVYLADSFKVDENASVEDLMRLLPGVEVDKDGRITTQGEQVQKILVDGEEFFGDDPTVVTKNLQAKVIDKVEVFDSKSEQAKFTGFDDGQREKTINLKMKDNMNKGLFGKAQTASDTRNFWDNSLMLNSFKNKRKFSAYVTNSSTGTTGLNWDDRQKFGATGNAVVDDDGDMMMMSDGDWDGTYNGEGLPKVNNVGMHYNNKWLEDKHNLSLNGGFKNNFLLKNENSNQIRYLQSNKITSAETNQANSEGKRYNASGKYEWIVDTSLSIILNIKGSQSNNTVATQSKNENAYNNIITSTSARNFLNNTKNTEAGADITLKKKLKTKGRTISLSSSYTNEDGAENGVVLGTNNLNGTNQILDQHQDKKATSNRLDLKAIYTEPIIKDKLLLELNYAIRNTNNNNNKITTIKNTSNTEYNNRVDSLSNDFTSQILSNVVGSKFKWQQKKSSISIGADVKYSNYLQRDVIRNINYDYSRINIFPSLNYKYKISQFSNLSFSYNGSTSQPNISQLQNIINNTDPLNIVQGNPNLKQGYRQNFNCNFWNYKALSDRSLWTGFWGGNTFNNVISTQSYNAATGQNILSYENANGNFNFGGYAGYRSKIKSSNWKWGANVDVNIDRSPYIANTIKSFGTSSLVSFAPSIEYNKSKVAYVHAEVYFTDNRFVNNILNQSNKFLSIKPSINGNVSVTKRLLFTTDIGYEWQQKNVAFANNFNRTIWNASLEYKLLKAKNLVAGVIVKDILNQNKGYERTAEGNGQYERKYLNIQRYIMASLVYNFSFGPVNKLPKDDDNDF